MQGMIEIVAALVTSLAAAVFAQFGLDLRPDEDAARPEVRRTVEREPDASGVGLRTGPARDC